MIRATLRILGLAAVSIFLVACQGGGHTRGMFTGNVMGKTEAEIVDKYGQPASIDRADPENPVLVFKAKTFDPDNANRTDAETLVYLGKAKDGRVVASDVSYRG